MIAYERTFHAAIGAAPLVLKNERAPLLGRVLTAARESGPAGRLIRGVPFRITESPFTVCRSPCLAVEGIRSTHGGPMAVRVPLAVLPTVFAPSFAIARDPGRPGPTLPGRRRLRNTKPN